MKSVSILVTTYNSPEALQSVFESLQHQSVSVHQVLICDDGSTPSTQNVIDVFKNRLPLVHCWQPDREFRAARSRNLALSRLTSDYLILIDGDCVLPYAFIEAHLELKRPDKIVAGSRNLLSKSDSSKFLEHFRKEKQRNLFNGWKFWRLHLGLLRDLWPKKWTSVRTCNLGLFSEAILSVNGFDENYIGWGLEDSDLVVRLLKHGLTIRSGRYATCVNHLYHEEVDKTKISKNSARFQKLLSQKGTHMPVKSILLPK